MQNKALFVAPAWIAVLAILFSVAPAVAQNWLSADTAQLQTLDKITARINTIEVQVNQPVRLGTLEITLAHCAYTPPEEQPEHAAFLTIADRGYAGGRGTAPQAKQVFSGWMFASSPAISGLEHPVYDVTLLSCLAK